MAGKRYLASTPTGNTADFDAPPPGEYRVQIVNASTRWRALQNLASWKGLVLALASVGVVGWAASIGALWVSLAAVGVVIPAIIVGGRVSDARFRRQLREAGSELICYVHRSSSPDSWHPLSRLLRAGANLIAMQDRGLALCPNDRRLCSGGIMLRDVGVGVVVRSNRAGDVVEAVLHSDGNTLTVYAAGRVRT